MKLIKIEEKAGKNGPEIEASLEKTFKTDDP